MSEKKSHPNYIVHDAGELSKLEHAIKIYDNHLSSRYTGDYVDVSLHGDVVFLNYQTSEMRHFPHIAIEGVKELHLSEDGARFELEGIEFWITYYVEKEQSSPNPECQVNMSGLSSIMKGR